MFSFRSYLYYWAPILIVYALFRLITSSICTSRAEEEHGVNARIFSLEHLLSWPANRKKHLEKSSLWSVTFVTDSGMDGTTCFADDNNTSACTARTVSSFRFPATELLLGGEEEKEEEEVSNRRPDYGSLHITFRLDDESSSRLITPDTDLPEYFSSPNHVRHSFEDTDNDEDNGCQQVSWKQEIHPVCNNFHQFPLVESWYGEYDISFLGSGDWRFAWGFQKLLQAVGPDPDGEPPLPANHHNENEDISSSSFVVKTLRFDKPFDQTIELDKMGSVQREAIIMEKLTGSPRVVDIYGYCGISIQAEYMPGGNLKSQTLLQPHGYLPVAELQAIEEANHHQVVPQNNLTSLEKLDMAIAMTEAIADLHGYAGGVIAHRDIFPGNYLVSTKKDGNTIIKLNDFEDSFILDYNPTSGAYCAKNRCLCPNGKEHDRAECGTQNGYHSPEELACRENSSSELVDVYTLGNTLYVLLTGLWPFYEHGDKFDWTTDGLGPGQDIVNPHIRQRPFVDERYRSKDMIHSELVRIMKECWAWAPERRPSIFQVLESLYEVQRVYGYVGPTPTTRTT
jgi:serine/threonine protein kinase